jgi:type VI secretion system protein ImpM
VAAGRGPGLFGKLPAKGDFLTRDLPPVVLQAWEGWLQTVMSTSRDRLGPAWAERWRTAPVWRFWIGPDVFGTACAGAMLMSVDKVGRQFPLVLILPESGDDFPPPPVVSPFESWYRALEARLREALTLDSLPDVGALLDGLAPDAVRGPSAVFPVAADLAEPSVPEARADEAPPAEALPYAESDVPPGSEAEDAEPDDVAAYAEHGAVAVEVGVPELAIDEPEPPPLWPPLPRRTDDPGRAVWAMAGGNDAVALLADVAAADHYRAAAGRSYWWTTGGATGAAAMIALQGLPDSAAFILLLQGGHA